MCQVLEDGVANSKEREPLDGRGQDETARLFFDVTVSDFGGEAALIEGFLDLFGEHDGTVFSAGAAKGNREVAFAFANVVRNQINEKSLDAAEEFAGLREGADVPLDLGISSCKAAEAWDKVGIGKKTHVKDEISIGGKTILIAETDDGDEHGARVRVLEALRNELA